MQEIPKESIISWVNEIGIEFKEVREGAYQFSHQNDVIYQTFSLLDASTYLKGLWAGVTLEQERSIIIK